MSDIDWSKAPEGTTHHVDIFDHNFWIWLKRHNEDDEYYWSFCSMRWERVTISHFVNCFGKTITPNPLLNKGDTQMKKGYTDKVTYEVTKEIVENAPEGTTHIDLFDDSAPYLIIIKGDYVRYWDDDDYGKWVVWYKDDGSINPKPIEDFKHLLDEVVEESSEQHTVGFKADSGKHRPSLVLGGFARALTAVSEVGTFGANKYTDNGWMEVENGINRYTDALMRHQLLEMQGEEFDQESELRHAAHLAWNALSRLELILRESEERK